MPSSDTQRYLVIQDRLVIRELEKVRLACHFQLYPQRLGCDANSSGHELVTALGHRVPDENVPVQAVHWSSILGHCLGGPIIIVRCPHFMRVPVLEWPTDPVDENGRIFLEDLGLALFPR